MESQPNPEQVNATPAPKSWLRQNATQLIMIAIVFYVVQRFLHVYDVLLAGFGLSVIIFLHELGHFLAAKACNVHVKTFSIGFGPALPFCSFKFGETTYKVGIIPLGGFVAMVGENTGETDGEAAVAEENDNDPRSFKNKSVPARMLIISAGVIMNILLAAVCFIIAYMHGVEEQPAIIQYVEPGSAMWQHGVKPGTEITRLNDMHKPWFNDIKPTVTATQKGDKIGMDLLYKDKTITQEIEPIRGEDALHPVLGFVAVSSMKLKSGRRDFNPQFELGSLASELKTDDGKQAFEQGDTIIAMTDPDDLTKVTPFKIDAAAGMPVAQFDWLNRLKKLAGKEITLHVQRKDQTDHVVVKLPAVFRKDTGLRMKMGPITAIRNDSPAAKAGIKARSVDIYKDKELAPGDVIVKVEVATKEGKKVHYSVDPQEQVPADTTKMLLDPIRLPHELNKWALENLISPSSDRSVRVTISRNVDHTAKLETISMLWDSEYADDTSSSVGISTTIAIGGLGLAYRVTTEVNVVVPGSPAAALGIQPNDLIIAVKFKEKKEKGDDKYGREQEAEIKPSETGKLKRYQWAFIEAYINKPPHTIELKILRDGNEVTVNDLKAVENKDWPSSEYGLTFEIEQRIQKADNVFEALEMGAHRTKMAVKNTYQGLYGMLSGRISYKLMSGPITLARASYILAGKSIWVLILLVGLISVNLAVVNFLPVPMLDGGHMMFLIYEGIFRRPPPERIHIILTWLGLICVLCLMLFTIGLDLWRVYNDYR